tara:strand:+ start:66 stop:872 length:807 start_codon:yes stop_codon:yes gene_type:complete
MEKKFINKHHAFIYDKLNTFINTGKIPHLLFFGNNGTGKRTLLNYLIDKVYENIENKNEYIIQINCCQFKGIKYIREDLKFFGKKQIHNHKNKVFKSIILYNADFLTIDAQSSLRRLIEIYSKNTRFFMITNNKNKIIRPILSRFCLIYVPQFLTCKNLHVNYNNNIDTKCYKNQEYKIIKPKLDTLETMNHYEILNYARELYDKCVSIHNLMGYYKKKIYKDQNIEKITKMNNFEFKLKYLMKEMKNDVFIFYSVLLFFRFNYDFTI